MPTCDCKGHKNNPPLGVAGDHKFHRDVRVVDVIEEWRWKCSCGRTGKFQSQSPNVAYHGWMRHVMKEQPDAEEDADNDEFVYSVYYQGADSYNSTPNPPVAVFVEEPDAIEFARDQKGYGFGIDWHVRPIPFEPKIEEDR